MKSKIFFIKFTLLVFNFSAVLHAETPKENTIGGFFGSKPIQISIGANGITQNKVPGYICVLDASLGGGHYSEWGQTEEDARSIVTKKCSDKSGLFLCKKNKAVCKLDE
jgi:hypothetical protein